MNEPLHLNTRTAVRTRCLLLGSSLVLIGTLMGAAPALASPAAPRSSSGAHVCILAAGAGPTATVAADQLETAPSETARAATFEVWQRTSAPLAEREIAVSYELAAEDAAAPMPDGAAGSTWTWQMRGNDSVKIAFPRSGTQAGTYRYTLRQVSGNQRGLIYDSQVFSIELFVPSGGSGADPICIVRDANGSKTSDVGWTVSETSGTPQGGGRKSPLDKIWGLLPKTGDTSAILLLALMLLACPLIAVGALAAKRRRHTDSHSATTSQEA